MTELPRLSHLQFLVLGVLGSGSLIGRTLRDRLADLAVKKSGPGFYQFMARLEESGYVSGEYEERVIDGQRIRERRYELTAEGKGAWETSREFYVTMSQTLADTTGLAGA